MANKNNISSIFSQGDYEQIFHTFYSHLCLFAGRILKDITEAEDIVQNVFITLLDKKIEIKKTTSIKSYLYSSVYNACINHIKHKQYIDSKMKDFLFQEYYEDNYLLNRIESEVMEEIFDTIELLPEECKKVFKLSYVDGLEVSKVAECLNISENTVKTQRLRARKFLQEHLKDLFPILAFLFPHFS